MQLLEETLCYIFCREVFRVFRFTLQGRKLCPYIYLYSHYKKSQKYQIQGNQGHLKIDSESFKEAFELPCRERDETKEGIKGK